MCSCPLLSRPTGLKQLLVVVYPAVFKANCFQKYSHLCLDIEPGQIKLHQILKKTNYTLAYPYENLVLCLGILS